MSFVTIPATSVDRKSPIDETLMQLIKSDLDALFTSVSDQAVFELADATVPYVAFGMHYTKIDRSLSQVYITMMNSGISGSTTIRLRQLRGSSTIATATASLAASSGNPAGSLANMSSTFTLLAGDFVVCDLVTPSDGSPEFVRVEY